MIVKRLTSTIYCTIHEVKIWYEDFIDEDNGEVVSIERSSIIDTYIARIENVPIGKSMKESEGLATSYVQAIHKNCRLGKLITYHKYHKIRRGEIKKYKNLKHLIL